jgi:A/G-specific adenine glycosylase
VAEATAIPEGARARLLAWYDAHARDLPWRRTRDPYAIWVSEIMLQQTRVDTVIPYYERFLERFPTMAALVSASEDEVLASWSGLGYYRRARLLHRGVAEAVERYGEVPRDAEARRSLPGIGAYTAGAIGSIAFDLPEPIVDGNVARVLARVHRIDTPLGRADTTKTLWSRAAGWALGERPGALNQALMELGATVCVPTTSPRCLVCPLAADCLARASGEQATLPIAAPKTAPTPAAWNAAVIRREDGKILFTRGDAALFGGLWGVPMIEGDHASLARRTDALVAGAELATEPLGTTRHVLSHRVLTVTVFAGRATGDAAAPKTELRWVDPNEPADREAIGISKLMQKVLDVGGDEPRAPRPTRARTRSPRSPSSAS